MNRTIYSFLLYLSVPFLLWRLWWRGRFNSSYLKRINERFALNLPFLQKGSIWLHTVSVGEAIAAQNLVLNLQKQYPHLPITVTCTTPTGSETIWRLFGQTIQHCYLPYDLPCVMRRFVQLLQPKIVILLETEIWPNLVARCSKSHIPIILANARMSDRSCQGYARFGSFTKKTLRQIQLIAVQTAEDATRFQYLGANSSQIKVTGSIKFDFNFAQNISTQANKMRKSWHALQRPIWIAASTHVGEDEMMLKAHHKVLQQIPNSLLILVPRHPERCQDVANLIREYKLHHVTRSSGISVTPQTQVLLGDTMGELMFFYALVDVAVIGGSFVAHGGHNFLEPAALKLPLLAGKHNFNFADIARQMEQAKALSLVQDYAELSFKITQLFKDNNLRYKMGNNAFRVLKDNQGSLAKLLNLLHLFLEN